MIKESVISKTANELCGVYDFPAGIPGFETYHRFCLTPDEDSPLAQLVAAEEKGVGFILAKADEFFPSYVQEIRSDESTWKKLGIKRAEDLAVWLILTLNHRDMTKTTVNLRAPILLNIAEKKGVQLILDNEKYASRYPLFDMGQAKDNPWEGAVS